MMKYTKLLLLFPLLVAACSSKGGSSPALASVNGQEISRAKFERFLTFRLGELASNEMPAALLSQMLDEYLIRQLLIAEAERAGISVSEAEVEQTAQENPHKKSATSDAS